MFEAAFEFSGSIFDIDLFTGLVVCGLVAATCGLVKFMTESMLLPWLYAPFLVLGGLTAKHFMLKSFLAPLTDKDSDTVLAVAVGVMVALVVLLTLTRSINAVAEKRSRISRAGKNTLVGLDAR